MIAIFSTQDSARLRFVLDFVFGQYFASDYLLYQDREAFSLHNSYKINYSGLKLNSDLHIVPTDEIFETDIKHQEINCFEWKETKAVFKTSGNDIPFDIFFAVFYLLSRYEEYLPSRKDIHGRYLSTESFLYKNEMLESPVVNTWLYHLAQMVNQKKELLQVPGFRFMPTIDIDQFYYFRHKGIKRQIGSLFRGFFKLKWKSVLDKKLIWLGLKPDFYDNADEVIAMHQRIKEKKAFILSSQTTTSFDKNISPRKRVFKENVLKYTQAFLVGIHPSYYSDSEETLKNEIHVLENILEKEVKQSRQHFLKMQIPGTYRHLLLQKIETDHTMGYAENLGYRAGVAFPFYFFDIEKNMETELQVLPFVMMDVTFKNYLKLTPEQAKNKIDKIIDSAKKFGGVYSSVWHNESLSEHGEWKGWKQVYTYLTDKI